MATAHRLCTCLLLTLSSTAAGQQAATPQPPVDAAPTEGSRWLAGLQGRFGELHDPVLMVYAKARLAALVCSQDKAVGTKQFRDAFDGLRNLPDNAFDKSPVVLAVDSFTALSDVVMSPAKNCNSDVSWYDANLDLRKDHEWEKANIWLSEALGMVDANPGRAAQLARAALSVSAGKSRQRVLVDHVRWQTETARRPEVTGIGFGAGPALDLSLFAKVLIKLRVTSPDLSDGLFQLGESAVMNSSPPFATELAQLATYLFPTETSVQLADSLLEVVSERGLRKLNLDLPTVPNIMAADLKGDRELAASFLASAAGLLQSPESARADPAGGFALAWQMLPKARDLAEKHVNDFETALLVLDPLVGNGAAKMRAELGAGSPPRKLEFGSPENDAAALGQACSRFKEGKYDAARTALSQIADASARDRVEAIVQFAETAESLPTKDAEQALERDIYSDGGAKRSLLYAAIASAADRSGALKAVALGIRDAAPLTPIQRTCILPPLAAAAIRVAPDRAAAILQQLVAADNDVASSSPSGGAEAEVGSSGRVQDIRCRPSGPVEFVNVHGTTVAFPLRPPGIAAFTSDAVLEQAEAAEFSRLEPVVLELRDETHLVNALLALAKLRFDAPSHRPDHR